MFNEEFLKYSFDEISSLISVSIPDAKKINDIISRAVELEKIDFNELCFLLNPEAEKYIDVIRSAAHKITLQRHGKAMRFYAPLYVSNECTNKCVYCGFNNSNNLKRITLTLEQVGKEAEALKKLGIQHVLLVAGEHFQHVGMDYLKSVSRLLSEKFATVSVEIGPLNEAQDKELFNSGIEGVVCYQETYNTELYKKYHTAGPKTNMLNRLETLDRAGSVGMRFLGVGTLLGLSAHRTETYFTALHARYLEKKYWESSLSISFPRIRPSESDFIPPYPVSNNELLHLISVLRLFLPDANLILSTRESASLRDKAVLYGVIQMSAGSRTNPLGYSTNDSAGLVNAGKQFEVSDSRTPAEIAKRLESFNYDPVFKDWDRGFRVE
ncbi:MAG: 2-iminoacetate synthase ThiH [Pseudomonadota bacterium]